jgi:chaperone modulatory protein CbpM
MIITMDIILAQVTGLARADLEHWIVNAWVRPDGAEGAWEFHEIDIARIRLIRELRDELLVNEEALPVVLSLLDQLHDSRRRLHELVRLVRASRLAAPSAGPAV